MKQYILASTLILSSSLLCAASNTIKSPVSSFSSNNFGIHILRIDADIPDLSCDFNNRAAIVETDPGAATMLNSIVASVTHSKKVRITVEGCTEVYGPGSKTAPHVIRVQLYRL